MSYILQWGCFSANFTSALRIFAAVFESSGTQTGAGEPRRSFASEMQNFTYTDPFFAAHWLLDYTHYIEGNIALIRSLAPPPETLLITRTSPLTFHRLQSAVNTALRKIADRLCVPLVDWDFLAHVHMLSDAKWAQVQPVRRGMKARDKSMPMSDSIPISCRAGMRTRSTQT